MFAMLNQAFSAIAVFFAAIEKLAKATNHLASWAEESAGSFHDEAKVQRQAKLNALNAESKLSIEQSK